MSSTAHMTRSGLGNRLALAAFELSDFDAGRFRKNSLVHGFVSVLCGRKKREPKGRTGRTDRASQLPRGKS
ncbi:MAG: hypothetical protein JRN72_02915 [Nitrososphaerota archaeon]|jgi:hypothetical protein|nr:hypothetical protein [Nitrososphaerota archaeon]MDG6941149.1 hypothetical protein [Nitrososphaerota archaeon]